MIALHPAALTRYLAAVKQFADAVPANPGKALESGSATVAVRGLLQSVVLHPTARKGPIDIEIKSRLSELLAPPPGCLGVFHHQPGKVGLRW